MTMISNILIAVLAAALGIASVLANSFFSWTRKPLAPRGDIAAFGKAAMLDMTSNQLGNGIVVLLSDGQVVFKQGHSIDEPVSPETQFQMGSLSKWISAWGAMTLVEAGKLDLDAPVSDYLTRWRLPDTSFDNQEVTVRRLLSHTAGFLDTLGYDGFAPGAPIQTLEASLTQAADTMEGNSHGRVRVEVEPGTEFHNSGGGYTLLQLLIEEVSGQSFEDYMQTAVFEPLDMTSATFELRTGEDNLADFYDVDGKSAPHYRYTALAAASLYASANDIVKYLQAHLEGQSGESIGRASLSATYVEDMRTPESAMRSWGTLGRWGLGGILYAPTKTSDFLVGHIGGNRPASSTSAIIDPSTGDGIVVFATGRPAYAIELASEWVYWHTGQADVFMLRREQSSTFFKSGCLPSETSREHLIGKGIRGCDPVRQKAVSS